MEHAIVAKHTWRLIWPIISSAATRGPKGLKVRDRDEEVQKGQEGSKRQRRNTGWNSGKSCK